MTTTARRLSHAGIPLVIIAVLLSGYGWATNQKLVLGVSLALDVIGCALLVTSTRLVRRARKEANR